MNIRKVMPLALLLIMEGNLALAVCDSDCRRDEARKDWQRSYDKKVEADKAYQRQLDQKNAYERRLQQQNDDRQRERQKEDARKAANEAYYRRQQELSRSNSSSRPVDKIGGIGSGSRTDAIRQTETREFYKRQDAINQLRKNDTLSSLERSRVARDDANRAAQVRALQDREIARREAIRADDVRNAQNREIMMKEVNRANTLREIQNREIVRKEVNRADVLRGIQNREIIRKEANRADVLRKLQNREEDRKDANRKDFLRDLDKRQQATRDANRKEDLDRWEKNSIERREAARQATERELQRRELDRSRSTREEARDKDRFTKLDLLNQALSPRKYADPGTSSSRSPRTLVPSPATPSDQNTAVFSRQPANEPGKESTELAENNLASAAARDRYIAALRSPSAASPGPARNDLEGQSSDTSLSGNDRARYIAALRSANPRSQAYANGDDKGKLTGALPSTEDRAHYIASLRARNGETSISNETISSKSRESQPPSQAPGDVRSKGGDSGLPQRSVVANNSSGGSPPVFRPTSFQEAMKLVEGYDVSTKGKGIVLWSGGYLGNRQKAEDFVRIMKDKGMDLTTLEMTPGGMQLQALDLSLLKEKVLQQDIAEETELPKDKLPKPGDPKMGIEEDRLWRRLSERFVEQARGNVYVFKEGIPDSYYGVIEQAGQDDYRVRYPRKSPTFSSIELEILKRRIASGEVTNIIYDPPLQ